MAAPTAAMSDYLFRVTTCKPGSIRALIEAIKDILGEANLEFTPSGISIKRMDGMNTILVVLNLHASKFEEYYCPEPVVVGINMHNFHKLIKTVGNSSSIVLYLKKSRRTQIGIDFQSLVTKATTHFLMDSTELDVEHVSIPPIDYTSILTMPSTEFQKIIRDMRTIGDDVEIQSASSELSFKCKGEFAEQETIFEFGTNGITPTKSSSHEIVQMTYSLKNLILFTKCTPLCTDITIYLRNLRPIVIEYDVSGLGTILLALSPSKVPPAY